MGPASILVRKYSCQYISWSRVSTVLHTICRRLTIINMHGLRKDPEWRAAMLKLVKTLNNFNFKEAIRIHKCTPFYVGEKRVGLIAPEVLPQLAIYTDVFTLEPQENNDIEGTIDKGMGPVLKHSAAGELTNACKAVRLHEKLASISERDAALETVFMELRQKQSFISLKGWRDEKFSIYCNIEDGPLFNLERSACCILGLTQYGVHINGYTFKDGKVMMWIGRRSKTKQTYPGLLDNMCAGGLTQGLKKRECAIKECQEEGSVPRDLLENLKSVGTVSYCQRTARGILPETEYLFDLELPESFIPCNADGEMESHELFSLEQIQVLIMEDQFKPNCALIIIDFMIRHGYISPDDEPNYAFILEKMHMNLQPDI